jgi:hypothetical protein
LTDPPDQEVTYVGHDVAVVLLEDSRLQGFRLSTGELLWERTTFAPCRKLLLARSKVHSGCGNKVLSFETATGKQQVVDKGPYAGDPILVSGGATVAVPGNKGRVALYGSTTGQLLASKVVPEISRGFQSDVLANPGSPGICVLGLVGSAKNSFTYRAGCYDEKLEKRWTESFVFPGDRPISLRQLGPEHLVLDDQESILDPSVPPGPGRGLVVHWRDGQEHPFDDKTFATLENVAGERLQTDSDIFALTRTLAPADPLHYPARLATVVSDAARAFAIIVNGTTALAGIDRSSGHVLFLVPVSVGPVWTLDVAGGMPIVRSRFNDRWEVTIHDPVTGSVRYRDSRPRPKR